MTLAAMFSSAVDRTKSPSFSIPTLKYLTPSSHTESSLPFLTALNFALTKESQLQKTKWLQNGHGTYTDLECGQHAGDVAKSFFDAAKKSNRLVIHFYRPTTRSCDAFHRALADLAPKHPETKFLKINVEGCDDVREGGSGVGAKYLVEKMGIVVMPTLLVVKDRKAEHHVRGFDELGGHDQFTANELAYVLGGHGALTRREDEEVTPGFMDGDTGGIIGRAGVNSLRMKFAGGNRGPRSGGYDDFDEDDA